MLLREAEGGAGIWLERNPPPIRLPGRLALDKPVDRDEVTTWGLDTDRLDGNGTCVARFASLDAVLLPGIIPLPPLRVPILEEDRNGSPDDDLSDIRRPVL